MTTLLGPSVTATAAPAEADTSTAQPVVALPRRTIDRVLTAGGLVVAIVLAVAGGLLTWGGNFATNYVHDELTSQRIYFPSAEALQQEGRADLVRYAGVEVSSGQHAKAYASYIGHHLEGIANGQTYADMGKPETAAKAEVQAAKDRGASAQEISALQAKADGISNQRNTLFKGETLRGLLLSAFAWSTIGRIAGIAATVAFVAAGAMIVLVSFGFVHLRRVSRK
jgi:hypothetical protein